jgi:hypothetical protein
MFGRNQEYVYGIKNYIMKKTLLLVSMFLVCDHAIQAETNYLRTHTFSFSVMLVPAIYPAKAVINPGQLANKGDDKKPVKATAVGKTRKMSFFNRLAIKLTPKKLRSRLYPEVNGLTAADKKAKTSLILGIAALGLALIPWYTILVAIPVGITAIVLGSRAKKMGTNKMTGIGFGIGALAVVAAWAMAVVIFISAFYI